MLTITHYYADALAGDFGTANAVRGWCSALAQLKAEVRLVVDSAAIRLPPPEGVEHVSVSHTFHGAFKIPRHPGTWLVRGDVLVIHGGRTLGNVGVARHARELGIPYVVSAHGVYDPSVLRRRAVLKRLWGALFENRHLAQALGIHLFFPQQIHALQSMGVTTATIIAPNGFAPPRGVTWDGGTGGYLLWLGRFDPECKGLDLLLHALHCLPPASRPYLRLHGPDWRGRKRSVARMVRVLGLEHSVNVGEPVYGDQKWKLLERAAGFVYPSRWDACPMAVLEALSIGVPALVTEYPLGRFVASHDAAISTLPTVAGLVWGLQRLLSEEAAEVGRRGPGIIERHFSWPNVAKAWLNQVHALMTQGQAKHK